MSSIFIALKVGCYPPHPTEHIVIELALKQSYLNWTVGIPFFSCVTLGKLLNVVTLSVFLCKMEINNSFYITGSLGGLNEIIYGKFLEQ